MERNQAIGRVGENMGERAKVRGEEMRRVKEDRGKVGVWADGSHCGGVGIVRTHLRRGMGGLAWAGVWGPGGRRLLYGGGGMGWSVVG